MRRLIFVNRFFFPDFSATSQLLSDLAFHLAAGGREVHVVTSAQIYDAPRAPLASLPAFETVKGVQVHRVPTTRFGRVSLVGRSFDYLTFYRSARRLLIALARPGDLIVAKTDPPLLSVPVMSAARRSGASFMNWLQDLYPEVAMALDVPLIRGPVAQHFARWRDRSLQAAEANVVLGELMAQKLAALGVAPSRIHVIANWCNDADLRPVPRAENSLCRAWGLQDKFVFGYSGNLGRVHEFATVLAAAERLRNDARFVFLMIGGGKRYEALRNAAESKGSAGAFRFLPYQPRDTLAQSLGVSDAHWVSLNPKLEGLIVPSKFYGIAAAGRPIVMIGDPDGELGRLVAARRCGFVVKPGDADALVAALLRLADEPDTLAQMGAAARHLLEARFSRAQALQRWRALLDRLDQPDKLLWSAPTDDPRRQSGGTP
jgi:glycosyltransferase involved in cell wall biosynthesis